MLVISTTLDIPCGEQDLLLREGAGYGEPSFSAGLQEISRVELFRSLTRIVVRDMENSGKDIRERSDINYFQGSIRFEEIGNRECI